jgi:hypothetical protein
MGAARSCPQCTSRKCLPNREKLITREVNAIEGLPAPLLRKKLHDADSITEQMMLDFSEGHLHMNTASALDACLEKLAFQSVVVQACLVSAIFALGTALPGLGRQSPTQAEPYARIKSDAFACLAKLSCIFEKMIPVFEATAFTETGIRPWSSHPVEVKRKDITGTGYMNTFQDESIQSAQAREAAFRQRKERFHADGGSCAHIVLLEAADTEQKPAIENLTAEGTPRRANDDPEQENCSKEFTDERTDDELFEERLDKGWQQIVPGEWYDYVVSGDYSIRCYPSSAGTLQNRPKCGHSLLTGPLLDAASPFRDVPILMAGDLCALKNATGTIDVLIITNNSGHFKPKASDLTNVIPAFVRTGIPEKRICLYGGPNNYQAFKRDLARADTDVAQSPYLAQAVSGEIERNPYVLVAQWTKQR